jgi:hypothetical protein
MAAVASTVKVWLEALPQVTFHEAAAVVTGVEVGADVSCTVWGFAEPVEQSPGRERVNWVSTLTGPEGPLLCSVAVAETAKDAPAVVEPGADAATVVSLTSAGPMMAVLAWP